MSYYSASIYLQFYSIQWFLKDVSSHPASIYLQCWKYSMFREGRELPYSINLLAKLKVFNVLYSECVTLQYSRNFRWLRNWYHLVSTFISIILCIDLDCLVYFTIRKHNHGKVETGQPCTYHSRTEFRVPRDTDFFAYVYDMPLFLISHYQHFLILFDCVIGQDFIEGCSGSLSDHSFSTTLTGTCYPSLL